MPRSPPDTCPRCDAPRVDGPECPRCGVIYSRAHPRAAIAPTLAAAQHGVRSEGRPADSIATDDVAWDPRADDARSELVMRAAAPPVALALSCLLVSSASGQFVLRTFVSMWLHELGHATTAWLCGYLAFPGPWRTFMPDGGRSAAAIVAVTAGAGGLAWRGWSQRRGWLVALGAAVLATQLVCVLLPARKADALITFAGDGGALVLATLLFATVYARPGSWFRQGALRWGFLAIGAATFVDVFSTWVRARSDADAVPLGYIEGVGLSDASKLLQIHRWTLGHISGTYVALGAACLAGMVAMYAMGLREARRAR